MISIYLVNYINVVYKVYLVFLWENRKSKWILNDLFYYEVIIFFLLLILIIFLDLILD